MGIPRLVSPDDHIQEPAHVWETRLPARLREHGPRVERLQGRCDLGAGDLTFVETGEGSWADVWNYNGRLIPILRIAAAAGLPRDEVDIRPVTFDEIRKGCYDPAWPTWARPASPPLSATPTCSSASAGSSSPSRPTRNSPWPASGPGTTS